MQARADAAKTSFQAELLASGLVDEKALFRALAAHLRLPYLAAVMPDRLTMRAHDCRDALRRPDGVHLAASIEHDGQLVWLVAPDRLNIPGLRHFIARQPERAARMRIVAPSVLRKALATRAAAVLLGTARDGLFDVFPHMSARIVATARQGMALGAVAAGLVAMLFLYPSTTILALHLTGTAVFACCVALRLVVAGASQPPPPALASFRPADMPVYTVLVALYREAEIVPELLAALGRIVWPRAKLEIKLVCESDDRETLEAIRTHELRSFVEVIEVPPGGPRTKPKALSYALPMTTGDLVVLYDAEDRPHPMQLVEAWQRFRGGGEDLACLQAPLTVANGGASWISALFGLEYAGIFRGLLPWLAQKRLVLPLGGTSNHFRGIR